MNILITGGAGFIGSKLANFFIVQGCNVTVLDNLLPQIHGNDPIITSSTFSLLDKKVKFIHGNITSPTDVTEAIKNQDIIVHLAAETGTGQSMYEIKRYVDVNVSGTALLLDILVNTKHSVKKVVVASSRAIYGEGKYYSEELGYVYPGHRKKEDLQHGDFEVKYPGCEKPLICTATDEASKLHPSSVYGITKLNQEQLVMTVCNSLNISAVALRYQNVYGPGQSLNNPYTGILSIFSSLIRNDQPINVFEDGKESRDFVFIDDVVYATAKAVLSEHADNRILNVGSGIPTSVLTVANHLCSAYQKDVQINISGNFRLGDIRHNYADITEIGSCLSFIPQYDFSKGISVFTEWVKTQPVTINNYQLSIKELKKHGLYN